MKRKALLIGNSGGLPGVKLDILHFTEFLKQDIGGQWHNSEIVMKMNPSKQELMATIAVLKLERNDFLYVLFSGHGAYKKDTILEINEHGESISESNLQNIATRQISIFDCCRQIVRVSDSRTTKAMNLFSGGGTITNIRAKYENRIMQAIEQQVSLYACSIGETALDSENGALYIQNLLKAGSNVSSEFKLIGKAHEEASIATINEAWRKNHIQHPTATLPKCISEQQLIMSVNPNYNSY